MKHGAIVHRAGEVGRVPAARSQHHGQREQAPLVIEAGLAVRDEVMAFAGHQHVGIAIEPQLDRSAGLARQYGGSGGDQRGLALLAAESAAHAPALHHHAIGGLFQGVRHDVLDFSGMLRRAVDQHRAVFLRQCDRDVSFQIEMILPTDHHRGSQSPRRLTEAGTWIAAPHRMTGQNIAFGRQRGADVE